MVGLVCPDIPKGLCNTKKIPDVPVGAGQHCQNIAGKIIPFSAALRSPGTVHINAAFSLILSPSQIQAPQVFPIDFKQHKKSLICSCTCLTGGGDAFAY